MTDIKEKEIEATTPTPAKVNKKYVVDGNLLYIEGGNIQFDVSEIPDALHQQLLMHGYKQKLVDTCAGMRKDLGRPLEIVDYEDAMSKVNEHLKKGEWSAKREGGTKRTALQIMLDKITEQVAAGTMSEKEAKAARALMEKIHGA